MTAIKAHLKLFPNLVFASYLVCAILQYFLGSLVLRQRYIVIVFLPLLVLFFREVPSRIRAYILLLGIISTLGALLTFVNHGYPIFFYLVLTYIQLAIILLLFRHRISEKIPLYLFYAFCVYVFFQYSLLEDINELFPEASRNTVSWIGLVLCALYYFLAVQHKKQSKNPLPLFVLLVLCVFSKGRSGILVALALLIAHYLFNYQANRKLWVQIFQQLLLLVLFVGVVFNYYSTFEEKLVYFNEKRLESEGRHELLQSYVRSIDYLTFFTGVDLTAIDTFRSYNHNPHNSYITCHISFGFMALFIVAFLIFALVKGMLNRRQYFVTSVYLCILLRIFTDKLAFIGNFDFLIYYASLFILTRVGVVDQAAHPTARRQAIQNERHEPCETLPYLLKK